LQTKSNAHIKFDSKFHLWLSNVNSFPLSVKTFSIVNGKKFNAFSKNFADVSALLLSCISRYISLVALSIAT
jgi:hypothetical protein